MIFLSSFYLTFKKFIIIYDEDLNNLYLNFKSNNKLLLFLMLDVEFFKQSFIDMLSLLFILNYAFIYNLFFSKKINLLKLNLNFLDNFIIFFILKTNLEFSFNFNKLIFLLEHLNSIYNLLKLNENSKFRISSNFKLFLGE